jgi:hypothetical protein
MVTRDARQPEARAARDVRATCLSVPLQRCRSTQRAQRGGSVIAIGSGKSSRESCGLPRLVRKAKA